MSQPIRDGETIASAGGSFELGFFSPGHSANRYLGIWYKKVSLMTAVWVANRNTPLINTYAGVLKVTNEGNLVLLNQYGTIIWSSYTTSLMLNPVAQLLESGNFVVRDAEDVNLEKFIWQSFDYPGDTLLPGMKQGRNTITGLDRYLSSWKSSDDPSSGDFTYKLDPRGFPELVLRKGSVEQFRAGPWNGLWFSGSPGLKPNPIYKFDFVFNEKEMYYYYMLLNSSVVTRAVLNENGIFQRLLWIDRTKGWNVYLTAQTDNCDSYALCGAYGCCNIANSPACGCLKGFVPKSPKDWAIGDWSDGCVRKLPLDCQNRDGFIKYSDVKLPDTRYSWFNRYMTLEECNMACLWNCSCMAYSNLDIRAGGSGCLLWFGNLIDIREFTENGQEIYIRMSSSEVGQTSSIGEKQVKIVVTLTVLVGMLVLTLGVILYIRKKKKLGRQEKNEHNPGVHTAECQKGGQELTPLFDWATVANATNNFSVNNKLGEGGFGPVYKGKLVDGQEIAVKRLSHNSTQGVDEFKNEVACVAKLQHRNLVKLLGCCIEEEKMLIYEYMPNKSLDFFIFDKKQSMLLNWQKRFNIINGISRGILYLHQDSRLRIIHRDLKASNILLDYEMNPKISDFGLARRIGGNETKANTARVVGTYGYMPPEYAIDGFFSVKSDVFSFGVVVLEIVSGKKNRGFCHPDHRLNLLGHAWRLFGEGRSVELIDASIRDSFHLFELLRSVHVGLLCVQEGPEDRPPMSYVILMLSSEGELPQPKQPGFFHERKLEAGESSSSKQEYCSVNEMTVTLAAR